MRDTPSRAARLRAGLTLQQAARRFNVQPETLAMWERRQPVTAWSYRRALEGARYYGCSVNEFRCCGSGNPPRSPLKKKAATIEGAAASTESPLQV